MKKIFVFLFSLLLVGVISYNVASADTIVYKYVDIVEREMLDERVYCPTTNSWDCTSNKHLHKLVCDYRYTLANGDVHYFDSDQLMEYYMDGTIKNGQWKVRVVIPDQYVLITKIEFIREDVYCPTTNSWDCTSNKHLHKLLITYRYTLANGDVHYLDSDQVEEYRRTGKIVGNKMKVY